MFVLGAYPSALHVRWTAPGGAPSIRAIPIDNEPSPFWAGGDIEDRVRAWKAKVGFDVERHGDVDPAPEYNGPSGKWVDDRLLTPLGLRRDEAWITDCLVTYRMSTGVEKALSERFAPFAQKAGVALPRLATHPSENEIVSEALDAEADRLKAELAACRPDTIYTLGNAALRVLRELVEVTNAPRKLAVDGYGAVLDVRLADRHSCRWVPLAHPAAPKAYQQAHTHWLNQR